MKPVLRTAVKSRLMVAVLSILCPFLSQIQLVGAQRIAGLLVSGMFALIAYIYPDQLRALLDSIFPNAGYYLVRIGFAVAIIYFFGMVIIEAYQRTKGKLRLPTRLRKTKPVTIILDIQRAAFGFEVQSTTDWFCIGIRDSKIHGNLTHEIIEGEISGTRVETDRFFVIPKGVVNIRLEAIFDMFSHEIAATHTLFVRKGDSGVVTIKAYVEYKDGKHHFADYGPLTRFNAPENEMEFRLPSFDVNQLPEKR